jgi:shikimate dehydrogenase
MAEDGLIGYNTDVLGFKDSLEPLLRPWDQSALVLGTGGASKAVAHGLKQLGISFRLVSRNPRPGQFHYSELNNKTLEAHSILINCTPLGTYPDVQSAPPIPYNVLNKNHLLYDLIYNPEQTTFLKRGAEIGARTKNGLEMLQLQADASWELWNR